MNRLFAIADRYLETSDWKLFAVLKFCLISLGTMLGMSIKDEYKKPVYAVSGAVFLSAYIPLMAKFFKVMREMK